MKVGPDNGAMSARICIDLCIADEKDYPIVRVCSCYCANEPPHYGHMYRQVQPGMSVVPGASMWWRMSSLAIDIALRADDGECSRPCTSNNGESCGGQSIANAKLVVAYTNALLHQLARRSLLVRRRLERVELLLGRCVSPRHHSYRPAIHFTS